MVSPLKQANWEVIPPSQLELSEYSAVQHYHTTPRPCFLCNTIFDHCQRTAKICGCCKILVNCVGCGIQYEIIKENYSGRAWNSVLAAMENGDKIEIYCTKSCSNMNRHDFGTCPNCKHENVKLYNSRCTYCANRELNASITCEIHGYQPYSFGGVCITCHNQTNQMREQARLQGLHNFNKLQGKELEEYQKRLELAELENVTKEERLIQNIEKKIKERNNELQVRLDDLFNLRKELKEAREQAAIQKPRRIRKKKLKNRTCPIHNVLFSFLDRSEGHRVCWECHKEKFKLCNNDFMNVEIPKLGGFFQPTFRVKEGSSIGQNGLELELVEKGVGHFVYIKFYTDENGKIKPLVAGLTASLLVDSSGTDVNFSTKATDGAARRYLLEHNLKWFEKFIYVIPVSSREESEKLEKQIIKEYKLFGS